jgi:hypothetical protein
MTLRLKALEAKAAQEGIRLSRVLTDRGTEFCGSESHEYELYLAVEDIDHTRTKAKSPQTNGICERSTARFSTSPTGWRSARRSAGRPRCLDCRIQRATAPSGPLVFRQDADADLP